MNKKLIITLSLLAASTLTFKVCAENQRENPPGSSTKNQSSLTAHKPSSNENDNPQGSSVGHQKSQDHYRKLDQAARQKLTKDYREGRNSLTCKVLRGEPISMVSQVSPLHKKIVMAVNALTPARIKTMEQLKRLIEGGIGTHVRQTPAAKKAFENKLLKLSDQEYFARLHQVYNYCLLYPPKTFQIPGLAGGYSVTKIKRLEGLKPA
jgi:hypothetical protein